MAAAAETASAKSAAPASAAEAAATSSGRSGLCFGAHAAGTGPAVRPGGVPQVVDEHIPGAEAAGVAVAPAGGGDQHEDEYHHEDRHHHADDGITGVVLKMLAWHIHIGVVVGGNVVQAVLLGQLHRPVLVPGRNAHGLAVAQILGGADQLVPAPDELRRRGAGALQLAGKPGRVVPHQCHLSDLRLVEPSRGVVVGHIVIVNIVIVLNNAVGAELIHILLHPRVGEGKRLVRLVGAVKIDIHIAVVEVQALDVVRLRRHIPDGAVGYADLQLLTVGQLLQRRPLQLHGDKQAAILRVGRHHNAVLLDVVVICPCGGGKANRRQ